MTNNIDATQSKTHQRTPGMEIRTRYALLIGVRDYVDPNYASLPHTVPDVVELAEVLREAGYIVRALHGDQHDPALAPTRENIWGELGNLARSTGPGDLLLVHFGGHGVLDEGRAYLLPTNARQYNLRRTAIDLDEFKHALMDAGAQARLLILDACHAGIGRDARGMTAAFERHAYLEATGTATLAACRQGEVAHEHHESDHGAFTYYLLEGLRGAARCDGGHFVTFNALSTYLTAAVKQWAIERGLQQWPNTTTALAGDPVLVDLRQRGDETADVGVASAVHVPNPFMDILAIRDPTRFVGREAVLRRMQQVLQHGSVALVGPRKIGKTSLLYRLAERLRAEPDQTVIQWDFFDPVDARALLAQATKGLGASGDTWDAFKQAVHGRRVVLLLDELDLAPQRGFGVDLLRGCRALCQRERGVRFLTTSRAMPKDVFPSEIGSWPYDFLSPQRLGPFTEVEGRALLAHPWAPEAPKFTPATVEDVLSLTACHPYRLQRAAHHCYEALSDPAYDWHAAYDLDMEALQ